MGRTAHKEQSNNQSIQYSIEEIKEIDFFIKSSDDQDLKGFDPNDLAFEVHIDFDKNIEERLVYVSMNVTIRYKFPQEENTDGEKNEREVLSTIIETSFKVKNLEELLSSKDEIYELPEGFLASILSIAYGSSRGIICSRSAGYKWNKAYLPIIHPLDAVRQLKSKKGYN